MESLRSTGTGVDRLALGVRRAAMPEKQFVLLGFFWGLVPAMLVVVNVISGAKQIEFLWLNFAAGTIFFPITYVFDDIVTEVYGKKAAFMIIITTFMAQIFCMFAISVVEPLPPATFLSPEAAASMQDAYTKSLGTIPLINIASLTAVFFGRYTNASVLSWMKNRDGERGMFRRFVASTLFGEAVDTLFFLGIAFGTKFPMDALVAMYITQFLFKVCWEIVAYPVFSKWIVLFVKKVEGIDQPEAIAETVDGVQTLAAENA